MGGFAEGINGEGRCCRSPLATIASFSNKAYQFTSFMSHGVKNALIGGMHRIRGQPAGLE